MVTQIPLADMDKVMRPFGFTILYVFPPLSQHHGGYDRDQLEKSFMELIEYDYPIFMGELRVHDATGSVFVEQPIELHANRATIAFHIDDQSKSDSTTDEAMTSLSMAFMPTRERGLMAVKCTLLGDGGLVIGIDMSHCLVDGEGCFTFMKTWGCRYRKVETPIINHDRHLLCATGARPQFDHSEFRIPQPTTTNEEAASTPAFPTTNQRLFRITREQMTKIKALATQDTEYVSTIDAITALFTMLITQARGHNQSVRVSTGVNGRRRLNPPLPPNYAGNVIFNAISNYDPKELQQVSTASLQLIARRIRESILQRTDAYMRDAIEFVAAHRELSIGVDFFFGTDLMFTSWANMGMYDADFGARPWYCGPPQLPCADGIVVVMEATRLEQGLDVLVLLEAQALEKVGKLWSHLSWWE